MIQFLFVTEEIKAPSHLALESVSQLWWSCSLIRPCWRLIRTLLHYVRRVQRPNGSIDPIAQNTLHPGVNRFLVSCILKYPEEPNFHNCAICWIKNRSVCMMFFNMEVFSFPVWIMVVKKKSNMLRNTLDQQVIRLQCSVLLMSGGWGQKRPSTGVLV